MKQLKLFLLFIMLLGNTFVMAQPHKGHSPQMPPMPKGAIMLWYDKTIPAGWHICDGTNGTPDLSGRFAVGTTDYAKLGSKTGDAPQTIPTSAPATTNKVGGDWNNGAFQTMGGDRAMHQHNVTISKDNLPIPATTVFFIMKIKD